MNKHDPLDAYADSLRERIVPPGFADELVLGRAPRVGRWERLWAHRGFRAAVWLVGASVFVVRLVTIFAFLIVK